MTSSRPVCRKIIGILQAFIWLVFAVICLWIYGCVSMGPKSGMNFLAAVAWVVGTLAITCLMHVLLEGIVALFDLVDINTQQLMRAVQSPRIDAETAKIAAQIEAEDAARFTSKAKL